MMRGAAVAFRDGRRAMRLNPRPLTPEQVLYPCQSVVEIAAQPHGAAPHCRPGDNSILAEYRDRSRLRALATRGGAEMMYPEFQATLKAAAPNRPAK